VATCESDAYVPAGNGIFGKGRRFGKSCSQSKYSKEMGKTRNRKDNEENGNYRKATNLK